MSNLMSTMGRNASFHRSYFFTVIQSLFSSAWDENVTNRKHIVRLSWLKHNSQVRVTCNKRTANLKHYFNNTHVHRAELSARPALGVIRVHLIRSVVRHFCQRNNTRHHDKAVFTMIAGSCPMIRAYRIQSSYLTTQKCAKSTNWVSAMLTEWLENRRRSWGESMANIPSP